MIPKYASRSFDAIETRIEKGKIDFFMILSGVLMEAVSVDFEAAADGGLYIFLDAETCLKL